MSNCNTAVQNNNHNNNTNPSSATSASSLQMGASSNNTTTLSNNNNNNNNSAANMNSLNTSSVPSNTSPQSKQPSNSHTLPPPSASPTLAHHQTVLSTATSVSTQHRTTPSIQQSPSTATNNKPYSSSNHNNNNNHNSNSAAVCFNGPAVQRVGSHPLSTASHIPLEMLTPPPLQQTLSNPFNFNNNNNNNGNSQIHNTLDIMQNYADLGPQPTYSNMNTNTNNNTNTVNQNSFNNTSSNPTSQNNLLSIYSNQQPTLQSQFHAQQLHSSSVPLQSLSHSVTHSMMLHPSSPLNQITDSRDSLPCTLINVPASDFNNSSQVLVSPSIVNTSSSSQQPTLPTYNHSSHYNVVNSPTLFAFSPKCVADTPADPLPAAIQGPRILSLRSTSASQQHQSSEVEEKSSETLENNSETLEFMKKQTKMMEMMQKLLEEQQKQINTQIERQTELEKRLQVAESMNRHYQQQQLTPMPSSHMTSPLQSENIIQRVSTPVFFEETSSASSISLFQTAVSPVFSNNNQQLPFFQTLGDHLGGVHHPPGNLTASSSLQPPPNVPFPMANHLTPSTLAPSLLNFSHPSMGGAAPLLQQQEQQRQDLEQAHPSPSFYGASGDWSSSLYHPATNFKSFPSVVPVTSNPRSTYHLTASPEQVNYPQSNFELLRTHHQQQSTPFASVFQQQHQVQAGMPNNSHHQTANAFQMSPYWGLNMASNHNNQQQHVNQQQMNSNNIMDSNLHFNQHQKPR
eukprot:GDKJ01037016.1.p1 GENE.GDKJ01037016.1~~GDKJ01037016.1.p1  ORF type:complete len:756 (-),score=288.04 GDKJ01037016.1:74-2290(-)